MRQVRYHLQCKKKAFPDEEWAWQYYHSNDVYEGWFWATSYEEPSPSLIETKEYYEEFLTHLDFRIVQEFRERSTQTW